MQSWLQLASACTHVFKVRELVASDKLDQMDHFRQPEKLEAWRRSNGFDTSEVLVERKHKTQGHVCSVDDPEHPRRPSGLIGNYVHLLGRKS